MPDRFLRIFGHELLQLGFRILVLEKSFAGAPEDACELGPRIRSAHVHDPHCFNPRPWRLDIEQVRGLADLNASPESLLGGYEEMLVERISIDGDFDPLSAPGN